MSLVAKEKKSFEQLIVSKETLVISLPDNAIDLEKERQLSMELGIHSSDTRISGAKQGSIGDKKNMKIVVDVRDFRSTLPSMLYAGGLQVVPRTLLVGDYVLSSEVCVERKGISDLFQSLASGRLYNQAESMSRYYSHPCLLIEFTPDRAFSLQSVGEISLDSIQSSSIITRLVQLALAFPQLRLLWSRTPQDTVSLFLALMNRHQEVDVEKAVQAGASDSGAGGAEGEEDGNQADSRATAIELLLSLPGITTHNYRTVMAQVENIADLSTLAEPELVKLIGQINGKKLFEFFREKLPDGIS